MSILIAIIVLIVLAILDANDKEKEKKPFIIGYNSMTGAPVYNKLSDIKPIRYDIHTGRPIFEGEEDKQPEPPKVKTEEDKAKITNSILMITGAILIVFASIIFLATSWEVLNGIIKSLILVIIQLVFFVFYLICKNTFDIPKTSKVFKYLALIFVPIVLLSLSCFEIVGDYLSVNGDGYLLFFGASFLITDIVYKMINYLEKDKNIAIMSYVCELIGIFLMVIHFLPDDPWAMLILSIYSLIYYALIELGIINREYYLKINHICNYIIVFILLCFGEPTFIINGSLLVASIYYFIKYYKNDNELKQRRYMVYFLALYIAALTVITKIDVPPYFVYNLALIPLLLLTLIIDKEKLKNVLVYGILIISMVIIGYSLSDIIVGCYRYEPNSFFACSLRQSDLETYYLLTFITAFILYVVSYIVSRKGLAKILAYSAFTLIFMQIFKMVELEEVNKYILLVTIVLVYFLEVLFEKLKDKSSDFFLPALIMIESIVLIKNYAVLIPLVFMILYVYVEKKEEALLVLPMLTSLSIFVMEDSEMSHLISYILIALYSLLSLNKKQFNAYTVVSIIALYYARLVFDIHPITFSSLLVLWSTAHLFVNREYKFFKFTTISSVLLLYVNVIRTLELDLVSPYMFGAYLYLITIIRYLFKEKSNDLKPVECIGIVLITLYGLPFMAGPTDAVIIIFSLLVVSILGFVMKWNHITYTGLACLVINIIFQTAEYWSEIPWYVYILIVGLALIIFAMLDEKRKQNKKKLEQEQVKQVDTK